MRRHKRRLLHYLLTVRLPIATMFERSFRKTRRKLVRKMGDEIFGDGPGDFMGLAGLVDDSTIVVEYDGEPRKSTYRSLQRMAL